MSQQQQQQAQVSLGYTLYRKKENRNTGVHSGGGLELVKPAREPASSRPIPSASLKSPTNIARSSLLVGPRRKKTDRGQRSYIFPQKPPGSRLWFSLTRVQHSPGSLTIELPSALTESGAYSPDRALPGSPRQCFLPLACSHLPKCTKLELGRGAHLGAPPSTNDTVAASQPID